MPTHKWVLCPTLPVTGWGTAGQYDDDESANTACVNCDAGKHSTAGLTSCISCNPGFYSPVTSSPVCTKCSPGQYADASGMLGCDWCPRGSETGVEARGCTPCTKGRFSNEPVTQCLNCNAGRYLPTNGGTYTLGKCDGSEFRVSDMCGKQQICSEHECATTRASMDQAWVHTISTGPGVNCTAQPTDENFQGTCEALRNGQPGYDAGKGLNVRGNGGFVEYKFPGPQFIQRVIVSQVSAPWVTTDWEIVLFGANRSANGTVVLVNHCNQNARSEFNVPGGGTFAETIRVVFSGQPPKDEWVRLKQVTVLGKAKGLPWVSDNSLPCETCAPGSYCPAGSVTSQICTPGTADIDSDSSTKCERCPAGTITACGALECEQCPHGQVDADLNPASACTDCQPGSIYIPTVIEQCKPTDPCKVNQNNGNNSSRALTLRSVCNNGTCIYTKPVVARPALTQVNESCKQRDPCSVEAGCTGTLVGTPVQFHADMTDTDIRSECTARMTNRRVTRNRQHLPAHTTC